MVPIIYICMYVYIYIKYSQSARAEDSWEYLAQIMTFGERGSRGKPGYRTARGSVAG